MKASERKVQIAVTEAFWWPEEDQAVFTMPEGEGWQLHSFNRTSQQRVKVLWQRPVAEGKEPPARQQIDHYWRIDSAHGHFHENKWVEHKHMATRYPTQASARLKAEELRKQYDPKHPNGIITLVRVTLRRKV